MGHFVPEGVALLHVSRRDRVTEAGALQQDIEFGIVQIVDIALRALSPAVNDPTTAISCVDQLTCILIRWAGRRPPASHFFDPPHVLRLTVPRIGFDGLLDLAFEQIRHYAVAAAAVSLRLMRALGDLASSIDEPILRRRVIDRGKRVLAGCSGRLQEDDFQRLKDACRSSNPASPRRSKRTKRRHAPLHVRYFTRRSV